LTLSLVWISFFSGAGRHYVKQVACADVETMLQYESVGSQRVAYEATARGCCRRGAPARPFILTKDAAASSYGRRGAVPRSAESLVPSSVSHIHPAPAPLVQAERVHARSPRLQLAVPAPAHRRNASLLCCLAIGSQHVAMPLSTERQERRSPSGLPLQAGRQQLRAASAA
jgi:hypothetical protein